MDFDRRSFVMAPAAIVLIGSANLKVEDAMYGLIGKMRCQPGKRAALAAILVDGVAGMPGCLSYVVANDPTDVDLIWITEVWISNEAHVASLKLQSVRDAISKGRPLIVSMDSVAETEPVGGHGLG